MCHGSPQRVLGIGRSLVSSRGKPLQAGGVALAVEAFTRALATGRSCLVTFYFSCTASPASGEGLRALARPSWGRHGITLSIRLNSCRAKMIIQRRSCDSEGMRKVAALDYGLQEMKSSTIGRWIGMIVWGESIGGDCGDVECGKVTASP